MHSASVSPGAVVFNERKTRAIQLAMAATAVAGIAVVATVHWAGALLVVGSVAGLISMQFVGGAGVAYCPACGGKFPVMQTKRRRVAPCRACGVWLAGADRMEAVAPDAVEKIPTYATTLPESFTWGSHCASCDAPAVKHVEVRSMPKSGVVLPIATVIKAQVPLCQQHAAQRANVCIRQTQSGATIVFRTLGAMQRFAADNGLTPAQSTAAFWEGTDAAHPLD